MRLFVRAIAWAWVVGWAVAGQTQVLLSKPDLPLLTTGHVNAVAPLADGSVLIGGSFSHVNSVPRANLAKLAPDGSLDPDWAPQTNGPVHALVADGFGNVFAGGNFTEVNGQVRRFLVKLSSSGTGALSPIWNPQVSGSVNAVIIDGNGDLLVGGIFSQVGSESRARIAKLSRGGTGVADPVWNPSADGVVTVIARGPDDSVLVAGGFSNIGGQPRQKLAKLSGSGSGQADPIWNPGVDDRIEAMATDAAGNVYAAGYFSMIGGQPRSNVARLSGGGTGAADGWNPFVGGYTSDLHIGPDGMIYVVGDFVVVGNRLVGGMARLSPVDASVDVDWRPLGADSSALSVRFAPNGDALIGGAFSEIEGQTAGGFVRIDAAANVVGTASTDQPGFVSALLRQRDGGLVVGGRFWKAGNVRRNNLARFRPDGSLDLDWDPSPEGGITFVYALAEDDLGRVYVAGSYDTISGVARTGLARYVWTGGVGTLDMTWDPQPSGAVLALATDVDGSIYAGGQFSQIGGQTRANLAKLSGEGVGSALPGWDGSANERVFALAVAGTGDVYVGGGFTAIGGEPLKFLARLSGTTGAADPVWAPNPDGWVLDVELGTDGSVYVGGDFQQIGPYSRKHLARIVADGAGTPYAAWNPAPDARVWTLALDDQGSLFIGGSFDMVDGVLRTGIAKLSAVGSAEVDPEWNPSISGGPFVRVLDLAVRGDRLDVSGDFAAIGGRARVGIASFSIEEGFLFADGFE